MFDAALRPWKDRLLDPVARAMGPRVSPNAVSLAGFAVGLAAVALLLLGSRAGALPLWLLSRAIDGLDGALARVHGRQTDFGGYLDVLLDFVLYALVPLALVLGLPVVRARELLALSALLASFYVNAASWMYLAAVLEKRARGAADRGERTTVTMPGGIVEGAETILLYTLFLLFPAAIAPLFLAMAGLVLVTVAQRLAWAARSL